ncbi:NADH-quinone oxidoreductase subunit J [Chloroflexi bacterium]|nr:hypothetical protein [Chloroflexota bacterium]MDC0252584.1 NADH-quinone oxidoreductase subunit J [Chloroflexota bacterium]RZP14266.1 MAG: hypothetical protein EVA32_01450 [Chloroflexota bacterium]|tara:strand:+ start:3647 stop:4291 length:645 start_codon:yes stop_codon:yes gene_type:complete
MDSSLLDIFIVFISLIGIATAIYVVSQTNVFRAAIALAISFMTVAVVFFAINAEFLGAVQILVYIGAVSVLMAFSVLLVKDLQTASSSTFGLRFILSSMTSLLIFIVLVFVVLGTDWDKTHQISDPIINEILFDKYTIDEENKTITLVNAETNISEVRDGLFKDSIIPIGSLLSTKYFISLQIIGLIIVACVIGSIAVTKNTIENDEEGDIEAI